MAYHANHARMRPGRRALGADAAPAGDPLVRSLQQQVNRFVSRILPDVLTHAVPVTGVMDAQTALYATRILLERAIQAKDSVGAGSVVYTQMYNLALKHTLQPRPWVDENVAIVAQDVKNFGDFLGLAPASGTLSKLVSDWRVWVAAAGVGILVLGRRRRSR